MRDPFGWPRGPFPARLGGPAWDFTSGALPSGVSFTRAGTATYFDAAGVPQTAAADVPRFDHDPVTGALRGLLIEESRTNEIAYSRNYNNAWWAKNVAGSLTITSAAEMSPDGTTSTDRFATSAASCGVYRIDVHSGLSIGMKVTATVLIKPLSAYCKIRFGYGGTAFTTGQSGVFDLVAGTHTVYGADNIRSMAQRPDGYWVVKLTATATAAGNATLSIYALDATAQSFALDHVQSEIGAFGTSIIPTSGAAATRAADSCVMTGADFSRWFNPSEGTILAEFSTITNGLNSAGGSAFEFIYDIDSSSAANSEHTLVVSAAYGPGFRAHTTVGGVGQAALNLVGPLGTGAIARHAYAYKANDFAACLNGGVVATDVSGTLPVAPDRMSIGSANGGVSGRFNGHLRRLRYWPTRLSNVRLQEITA